VLLPALALGVVVLAALDLQRATAQAAGLVLTVLLVGTVWTRRTRQALDRSQQRVRSLLEHSSELIAVVDDDQRITFVTAVFERELGYETGHLIGVALEDLVHPEDQRALGSVNCSATMSWRMRHQHGSWHEMSGGWTDLRDDPAVRGYVLTVRGGGAQQELRDQLEWQAFHDGLTGLPNRLLFEDRVTQALERARRDGQGVAMLFIDLDDFKAVNDSIGHPLGDRLLREFAERLDGCIRRADTAGRLYGDEFAVLLEGADATQAASIAAQRIHDCLVRPVILQEDEVILHASVGIATADASMTTEDLIRNADIAMYAAKSVGKARSMAFTPSMHQAARKRLELSGDLRHALSNGEISLEYQPLVQLSDGNLLGVEALARWAHPRLGDIPPVDFIPLAEETGLIVSIGRFVLDKACKQMSMWKDRYSASKFDYVSVNLSVRQFRPEGQIVKDVVASTRAAGLDPAHLMLEITESVLMNDREAIVRDLNRLRALGVRIAIDDFGTGYSALSYLRHFPIDTVKMDRSFVHDLGEDEADAALIRSVVELGEALDMKIVAEGIENRDQLDSVSALNCDVGQGYFFSVPVGPEAIDGLLSKDTNRPGTSVPDFSRQSA
jgi:diguanylate cyclase (GGDEF)-like protein/PAS domain S-box-containing protein